MNIQELQGKEIKINKNSITCYGSNGKTCGVVRNITSLKNIQLNKATKYFHILKKLGVWGKISTEIVIIADNEMYIIRNLNSKNFHDEYGFFNDREVEKYKAEEEMYNFLKTQVNVIECVFK